MGFSKVGFSRAEVLSDREAHLREWLARGYHGEMKWMERDPAQRANPQKLFPNARSVMVVAMNYYTPYQHTAGTLTGKVSRYAWGGDYHDVVGETLRALLVWIKSQ